jgi:branched-chain amino acid transport system ATP-binding protein
MMLEILNITAGYLRVPVLENVTVSIRAGRVMSVLGANGAGKSTLVRVVAGILPARTGQLRLEGRELNKVPAFRRARAGLGVVTEQKDLFLGLSVADHLELGGRNAAKSLRAEALSRVHDLFPILADRGTTLAGNLSGGQQQMLAIGRALAGAPTCLVLDEPSLGVAPQIIDDILRSVRSLADSGLAVLLVEQNASMALGVSDEAVVLQRGRVAFSGEARELAERSILDSLYLGGV